MLQTNTIGFEDAVIWNWMKDHVLLELIASNSGDTARMNSGDTARMNSNDTARMNSSDTARMNAMLANVGVNAGMHCPAIAVIEPVSRMLDEHDKRKLAEDIRHIVEQKIFHGQAVFIDESGRVCLLFSRMSNSVVAEAEAGLAEGCACPVNIGVGGYVGRLHDIHTSYVQALQALEHKFYSGQGRTNYFDRIAAYTKLKDYPTELEKELFERIKAADSEQDISSAVDHFYSHVLRGGPVVISDLLELTVRLGVGMEKRVLHEPDNEMSRRFDIISVVRMETLEQIKQYVGAFFAELKEVLSRNDKESHRSIIKKTIQYMEMECQNASLNNVAKKVYMTPTYLSLLFKMNTGKTFIEQLTDIRMNKAKDMLRSTYLKNYEVAERVGYHDSRYFSQIFKKKVGLSPSEYRESVGR